jgi:hypothetical protein
MSSNHSAAWHDNTGRPMPLGKDEIRQRAGDFARQAARRTDKQQAALRRGDRWAAIVWIAIVAVSILGRGYLPRARLGERLINHLFGAPGPTLPPIDWFEIICSVDTIITVLVTMLILTLVRFFARAS